MGQAKLNKEDMRAAHISFPLPTRDQNTRVHHDGARCTVLGCVQEAIVPCSGSIDAVPVPVEPIDSKIPVDGDIGTVPAPLPLPYAQNSFSIAVK